MESERLRYPRNGSVKPAVGRSGDKPRFMVHIPLKVHHLASSGTLRSRSKGEWTHFTNWLEVLFPSWADHQHLARRAGWPSPVRRPEGTTQDLEGQQAPLRAERPAGHRDPMHTYRLQTPAAPVSTQLSEHRLPDTPF